MMIAFPLTAAKIVGTDLFQAALLLWVAGFGHFVTGSVDLHATGWLLIGSIPGVLLGSQLTVKLPDRALGSRSRSSSRSPASSSLDPPGANAIIIGVVGVALVVGLGLAGRRYCAPARPRAGARACHRARARMSWPPELPVMRVRWARPTDRLDEVVAFYRDGLGLRSSAASKGTPATTA